MASSVAHSLRLRPSFRRQRYSLFAQAASLQLLRAIEKLRAAPLAPSAHARLDARLASNAAQRQLIAAWNRCGGLLAEVARELGLDAGNCLTVLLVESGCAGFAGRPPRLVIRFENHVFFDRWAVRSPENRVWFERHFCFDQRCRWKGHYFREGPDAEWQPTHRGQESEWQALEFAQRIDRDAALCSISMGAPQIMGFHFATLGYANVTEMFTAFADAQSGAREQVLALFDFLRRARHGEELLAALRREDFFAFARQYNGPGQAAVYADKLKLSSEQFALLRKKAAHDVDEEMINAKDAGESGKLKPPEAPAT
jgi:hypothetical protein